MTFADGLIFQELGPFLEGCHYSFCDLCLLRPRLRSLGYRAYVSYAGTGIQVGSIACGAIHRCYHSRLGIQQLHMVSFPHIIEAWPPFYVLTTLLRKDPIELYFWSSSSTPGINPRFARQFSMES